jgi:hypothetical protein
MKKGFRNSDGWNCPNPEVDPAHRAILLNSQQRHERTSNDAEKGSSPADAKRQPVAPHAAASSKWRSSPAIPAATQTKLPPEIVERWPSVNAAAGVDESAAAGDPAATAIKPNRDQHQSPAAGRRGQFPRTTSQ